MRLHTSRTESSDHARNRRSPIRAP
jgi:hypothetical protein